MTTIIENSRQETQQPGCLSRIIILLSGVYLLAMISYLGLRLIFGDDVWVLALINAFTFYLFTPLFILLPLVLLAQLWRMFIRLGLVALLGIVWFGPFFQPNIVTSSGAPTLTIVTFNVEAQFGEFNSNIDAFERWLLENDVDIVVLQETPFQYIEDGIIDLSDTFPEQHMQVEPEHEGLRRMILSRYPVLEVTNIETQQRTVIDYNGQPIAIYNVHFRWPFRPQARFGINTDIDWLDLALRYDEDGRNAQIDTLLGVIADETLPFITAGDFNTSQHSIIYSSFAVEMTDSFRSANSGLGATWPVDRFWNALPLLRLDYVWHDENFTALSSSRGPDFGSDHLPVIAVLEVDLPDLISNDAPSDPDPEVTPTLEG